jgi:hypothetical protein
MTISTLNDYNWCSGTMGLRSTKVLCRHMFGWTEDNRLHFEILSQDSKIREECKPLYHNAKQDAAMAYVQTYITKALCSNHDARQLSQYSDYTDYGIDDRDQELGSFLLITASRPALESIQPPIQWVPRLFPRGVKWLRREADQSPPSNDEIKNAWSYTSAPPIWLHGVMLCSVQGQLYLQFEYRRTDQSEDLS